jgi:integrase
MLIKMLGRKVTMHGCRSTFRDWCAETGKDAVLAEKSLMHSTGNEVEQAYQRSDLLERRRPLMQAWGDAVWKL